MTYSKTIIKTLLSASLLSSGILTTNRESRIDVMEHVITEKVSKKSVKFRLAFSRKGCPISFG